MPIPPIIVEMAPSTDRKPRKYVMTRRKIFFKKLQLANLG